MVCQGDPLVLGTEILALDQGGGLFRFDSAAFPNPANAGWRTGGEILALIRDLHGRLGSTVVIVTHDMTVANSCGRTIALRDGRIVEDLRR